MNEMAPVENSKPVLVLCALDNLVIDNYKRKMATYLELGWDKKSIRKYLQDKNNMMRVASFNTYKTSFTASSRRNKYYTVYNRNDMLEKDNPWQDSVKFVNELNENFKIFIISARKENLEKETRNIMKKMGFPMKDLEIYFLKQNQSLANYRRRTFELIANENPSGYAITLSPNDIIPFSKYDYKVMGFTSLKYMEDFSRSNKTIEVCVTWRHIISYLRLELKELEAKRKEKEVKMVSVSE
ncbi:MAG: hypothetical protein GF364_10540, partial [Candidatus Lokiarchaeota archaeon]|nr:hypothetical protein [Candidatus Lokiarchaeota archaeon]